MRSGPQNLADILALASGGSQEPTLTGSGSIIVAIGAEWRGALLGTVPQDYTERTMPDFEPIRRVLEANPEVRLAYVFGSVARGQARPRSDADVAVLFATEPSFEAFDRLVAELERATGRRVDLIDLRRAPPLLVHEVLSSGKLIVCREAGERGAFEARAVLRFLDTAHLRRIQHAYLREWAEARRAP